MRSMIREKNLKERHMTLKAICNKLIAKLIFDAKWTIISENLANKDCVRRWDFIFRRNSQDRR